MLVPEIVLYRRGMGQDEYTATPGPAMSTWPPSTRLLLAEKSAIRNLESTAPTAMIDGLLAGTPTKPGYQNDLLALLPAAATISVPACRARRPAVS